MGLSLQHHVAEILRLQGVRFTAQARTEAKNQPDFLFPGRDEYQDPQFPEARLTMLAAKSTCKDRWRQILTEAARIPSKHLITLDQALSIDQLGAMNDAQIQVVVPVPLQVAYSASALTQFMSLRAFIDNVKTKQVG